MSTEVIIKNYICDYAFNQSETQILINIFDTVHWRY